LFSGASAVPTAVNALVASKPFSAARRLKRIAAMSWNEGVALGLLGFRSSSSLRTRGMR
jgi:hypothetical protein